MPLPQPDVHTDWVRDVAWCPNMGLPQNLIASCSQDGTVVIWDEKAPGQVSNGRFRC